MIVSSVSLSCTLGVRGGNMIHKQRKETINHVKHTKSYEGGSNRQHIKLSTCFAFLGDNLLLYWSNYLEFNDFV